MEGIYTGIVRDHIFIHRCIDREKLKEHTSFIPFAQMDKICWYGVKYLHILQNDGFDWYLSDYKDIGFGCHVSHDGKWVLLLGTAPEGPEKIVDRCRKDLVLLNIMTHSEAPICVSHLLNLRSFRLIRHRAPQPCSVVGVQPLRKLEKLELRSVCFGKTLDVSFMPGLTKLYLHAGELPLDNLSVIYGIHSLRKLFDLSILGYSWGGRLDLSQLTSLTRLQLFDGKHGLEDRDPVTGLEQLSNLNILTLSHDQAGEVFDASAFKNLTHLYLDHNPGLRRIDGLSGLQDLKTLSLLYSGIRTLPEEIRGLKKLTTLNLSGLELEELPPWLPELGLEFSMTLYGNGIQLYETKVKDVDMRIFERPREMILQWFEEQKKGSAVPLNEVKVVFLGDGEAGKTHSIARLLKGGEKPTAENFDGKATPGIVIQDKDYTLDGRKIQVHFWDFGGQEILHSMHRMFLTDRTLYVVIINARDDTQDDRARYWLHNIKSFAGSAPVLLVLNKLDQNPNASIDMPNLQKMYGGLKDVVRMSALEYSKEEFNSTFTEALLKQVQALGTLGTLWPKSWLALKSGLENMRTHYIHGNDYEDLCDNCGVEQNREELLHWFNDLGVSFCYGGSAKLEDYVILKPEWLTNAIYIILFNKCADTENGVIPHDSIYRMLQKPRNGQDQIRRVLKDVFYRPEETDYVLDVIRKFRLSYKVREDAEFIPVLCQRESMAVAEEYENDPNTLEFRMSYEYLPDNVIHRLMVEMRQDLDTGNVWRTGARFVQQGTGLSAVVRSEGDVLRIFVRSGSPLHLPNTYLHIIKGNIDQIITDMKLQTPYSEVIYKADGITEAFDYEDLIFALREGETTYRSKDRRRRTRYIPIQDILNQSGRTAELELDKLRSDIITACMQLQGNSKFWDATEDEWNTAVRDALRNMDYLVNDQSFQGISGGGKKAGELDLEIRKDAKIPWTICEALKIKDKSRAAWNEHLERLLDNYNPSGLNYLFLVTYVDCGKDRFQEIWDHFSEHIKWFDPGNYERLPSSFSHIDLTAHNNPHYIRAARCTYDRAGSPTTVCHIFARMGR